MPGPGAAVLAARDRPGRADPARGLIGPYSLERGACDPDWAAHSEGPSEDLTRTRSDTGDQEVAAGAIHRDDVLGPVEYVVRGEPSPRHIPGVTPRLPEPSASP